MLVEELKKKARLVDASVPRHTGESLLISVPSLEKNGIGLYLVDDAKLYAVENMPCTGLTMNGSELFVSKAFPDHLRILKIGPGEKKELLDTSFGDVHDIKYFDDKLFIVSTGTNEVISISANLDGKIVDRWEFTGCGESWHLNCLDVWNGRLVVSAFGDFQYYRQYKGNSSERGLIVDVATKEVLWSGLSTPHSPRLDKNGGRLVCDSKTSRLLFETKERQQSEIYFEGAFTRGMAFGRSTLYVGLSASRRIVELSKTIETSMVALVDSTKMEKTGSFPIPAAEIYDIIAL